MNKLQAVLFSVVIAAVNAGNARPEYKFSCSESGRFKVHGDTSCRKYHLCFPGQNGEWLTSQYECRNNQIFDEKTGKCAFGDCDSSESSESSQDGDGYENDEFQCRKAGRYDDVRNPFCNQYYDCKQHRKGGFIYPVPVFCSRGTKYHPGLKECSPDYECPRKFQCQAEGRFDDGNDASNKRYYLCIAKKHGGFQQKGYICPAYSRFVQDIQLCQIANQTSSDELALHDFQTPTESWDHLHSITCNARGFKNIPTSDIADYHYCDMDNVGELYMNILQCSVGCKWDPDVNVCDCRGRH